MEEAAFETICSGVDPSLDRLRQPGALRWWAGRAQMPTSYAVFVTGSDSREPEWIEYLGANRRRLTESALSDRLEVVDRAGSLELLRTGHGAVVQDLERNAFAWV